MHVDAGRDQQRASEPLELKSQVVMSHPCIEQQFVKRSYFLRVVNPIVKYKGHNLKMRN